MFRDTGYRIPDTGFPIPDTRYLLLVGGSVGIDDRTLEILDQDEDSATPIGIHGRQPRHLQSTHIDNLDLPLTVCFQWNVPWSSRQHALQTRLTTLHT